MPRSETFLPDGKRVYADPVEVARLWMKHCPSVPVPFILGTAQHESSFTVNEVDTEESGFVSKGIFQIADSEADATYHHGANLLDLEDSVIVMAALCNKKLLAILNAAKLVIDDSMTEYGYGDATRTYRSPYPPSTWAYLFIAHNQGLTACLKTIAAHGLDWPGYKARNGSIVKPGFNGPSIGAYGDDVISGGVKWPAVKTALGL
jgi:hypothetical protein